jgi:hypothetical protein
MTKPIKIHEWKGEPVRFATAKRDGNWLRISGGKAWTSGDEDITNKVRNYDWWPMALRALGPGDDLWCEVYVPGKPASDVRSWLPEAQLMVFAVPHLGDVSMQTVADWCMVHNLEFASFVEAPLPPKEELLAMAKRRGYEGWVLKQGHLRGWYKLKEVQTADLKVVGFKDGNGKFIGLVGSLILADATGRIVANASGMDDMTRALIDENADLGRIAEVAYQYVGAKGKLRHPRFIRWRDDKSTADMIKE